MHCLKSWNLPLIFDFLHFLACPLLLLFFSILQYTFVDLLSKVQASETELLEALKKIKALEIDGGFNCLPIDHQIS